MSLVAPKRGSQLCAPERYYRRSLAPNRYTAAAYFLVRFVATTLLLFPEKNIVHTFLAISAFSVCFFTGCVDEGIEPPTPKGTPVAQFAANPKAGHAPLNVNFDASASYDPDGTVTRWIWSFGDGNKDSTSGPQVNYDYNNAGTYPTKLELVDDDEKRGCSEIQNIVVAGAPYAQIAFSSTRTPPGGGIYKGDLAKTVAGRDTLINETRLTTSLQDVEPAWSPDGQFLLFTSGGIWKMNANGSDQVNITSAIVENARNADWGSNNKIVFEYSDLGEEGIATIDPDGSSFTSIYSTANGAGIPTRPRWSPDCTEIVFNGRLNGNWDVWKMKANGDSLTNLTNHPSLDQGPEWSPDGDHIFFYSFRYGNADIFRINSYDGSNLVRITDYAGIEIDLSISVDASRLIFAHGVDLANLQVYIINSDGTSSVRLTFEGTNRYPDWKP